MLPLRGEDEGGIEGWGKRVEGALWGQRLGCLLRNCAEAQHLDLSLRERRVQGQGPERPRINFRPERPSF